MKTCTRCHELKDESAFQRISSVGPERLHSHCRACRTAYINDYRKQKRAQTNLLDFKITPFGSDSPNAKLTADDVRHIRALLDEQAKLRERLRHLSAAAIAEKFDISPRTVYAIAAEDRYTEVA